MSTWTDQLTTIQKLRDKRRKADDELYSIQLDLLRGKATEDKKNAAKKALDTVVKDLQLAVEKIYEDPNPRKIISNLDDSIPFLLLPVRIETRFKITGDLRELWLRVYPDDIAVHTHEKTLTDEEIKEGEKYWSLVFKAEEDEKKAAWSNLVAMFSAQRSAWIATETKPTNWNEATDASQLQFPKHTQSKPFEWSRAPRTSMLPDKFVVLLYHGESLAKEVSGKVIPDELYVGPDPLESEAAFTNAADDNILTFGSEYDWTADFDKAVEKGMGFKIPLNADEAQKGFDKILVVGVYASADAIEGKQAVETMIDNHHYSPKGFGIVKQGTPTNNTEQESSGFSKKDPFDDVSYFVETGNPLFEDDEDCDGKNLAEALGIDYTPLKYVLNSDAKERKEAIAMNTALYPSTLGYYFGTMLRPVLSEASQNTLRDFFVKQVSGPGPLPAIRVGNQPYGVVLTSDFNQFAIRQTEPEYGNSFLNMVLRVLRHYHGIWKTLLPKVQYTGKPGTDPSNVLLNILGLQPGSVSFFQRNGFSTESLLNRDAFEYNGQYYNDLVSSFVSKANLLNFFNSFGWSPPLVNSKPDIPQLLRLVYQHYHTRLNPDNVVENFPLSETDGLHLNYINWLLTRKTVQELERENFGENVKAPTSLLYMQLRRSLLLAMADASVKWFNRHNIVLNQVMEAQNFHNIRPERDLTKWEVMKGKVKNALPRHPQAEMSIAEHLLSTGRNEADAAFLNDVKDALKFLANKPTATLERRFCEHIDTCSYRLDSWQTAIFDQRLRKQRGLKESGEQPDRKKGIYLGAFGWVEDVRPGNKQQMAGDTLPEALRPPDKKPYFEYEDNGGFVHAPSINQATAAAVLRSGYLSHATSANPDVMAVNLSSERVRRALFIIEGLRNGQTLEELLGFQFERGLHDRGSADDNLKRLNEYIYNFREKFPIKQHVVQQAGMPTTTTETIERYNIVNGLTLAETTAPFPYNVTLDAIGMNEPFRSAFIAEKDKLEDTLDAVKDLFLSESVFQMTQGNFDRAAAVTTALRDASVPPEIEVINTPATNHLSFTNRVTIQFNAKASFAGVNPRARMEPGMNEWLRTVIGDPAELICLVRHNDEQLEISMADCNLQPIDLLYLADAGSELESRIVYTYRQAQGLPEDVTVNIQFIGNGIKVFLGTVLPLIKKLKQLITDSRPLHAQDFGPGVQGYMIEELQQRVEDARTVFSALLSDLSNADIQPALIHIAGFGLPDSFPKSQQALADQAATVAGTMTNILQKVDELLQNITVDSLIKAGKLLFGESFNILPHFTYNNATDLQQSNSDRDQLLQHATSIANMQFPADEWMQKAAPVRPKLARWDEVRTIYELYHDDQLTIAPVQLPYVKNDSWVAVEFAEDFNIIHDTLSVVIHGEPAFATDRAQCGILIDEWTEVVPGKEALTGITFNYNQPDAMPPQALLLAVSPIESGSWSWESLVGILNDTLLRAKLRAVEPQLLDTLQRPDTGVMLPAILSTFSQFGLDISLDYRMNVEFYENNLPLTSI